MIRGLAATAAGALVVTASMSPLLWLWPVIVAGHWYSFPLLVVWFVGTLHAAAHAVIWAAS
jgi:hypothetical protein